MFKPLTISADAVRAQADAVEKQADKTAEAIEKK